MDAEGVTVGIEDEGHAADRRFEGLHVKGDPVSAEVIDRVAEVLDLELDRATRRRRRPIRSARPDRERAVGDVVFGPLHSVGFALHHRRREAEDAFVKRPGTGHVGDGLTAKDDLGDFYKLAPRFWHFTRCVQVNILARMNDLIRAEAISPMIHWIRGEKVILDRDLAVLYGVETRALKQAVKRNPERFPGDFMFELADEELDHLRSQNVISSSHGGLRHAPMAFTEQGVAMLSSVLRSKRAVQVNIEIMRAFVRLRRILTEHKDLARKLDVLERKYDAQFKVVFDAIRKLMEPPPVARKRIGFRE